MSNENEQRPKHHPTMPPSAMNALVKCPFYKSNPAGSDAAKKGTDQHAYAEALLRNDDNEANRCGAILDADGRANAEWYAEHVRANAGDDLEVEVAAELQDKNYGVITYGTIDAASRDEIWDYKSGEERGYNYQMAAYALMRMRQKGLKEVTAHICYGKTKKIVSETYTEESAWDMVETVLAIINNPERQEMPNEYCAWCEKSVSCPALTRHVTVVAAKYAPEDSDKIKMWEPSEMSDPSQVSRALYIARIVGPWASNVEKRAKELIEKGENVPGWSIMEKRGARQVKDILTAFQLCGLPEQAFLSACTVGIGKLEEAFATTKGMKKAVAKRELNELLAGVMENKAGYKTLVKNKEE